MPRPPAVIDVFSAIGHPRRRTLISTLATGDKRVSDLVDTLNLSQSTVSEHLSVLRSVGLVNSERQGREQIYSLNFAPLYDVTTWITQLEAFWDSRHQRLADLLETIDEKEEQ